MAKDPEALTKWKSSNTENLVDQTILLHAAGRADAEAASAEGREQPAGLHPAQQSSILLTGQPVSRPLPSSGDVCVCCCIYDACVQNKRKICVLHVVVHMCICSMCAWCMHVVGLCCVYMGGVGCVLHVGDVMCVRCVHVMCLMYV